MESLDKLREWLPNSLMPRTCEAVCRDYLDEIEREISEKYMELPVDADGVPIHVGDKVRDKYLEDGDVLDVHFVSDIAFHTIGWTTKNGCEVVHVKPRTIEDVLTDFGEEWIDVLPADSENLLAKYADELRGIMEGE